MTAAARVHPRRTRITEHRSAPAPIGGDRRPRVRGKFLFVGDEKLYVRGVTYGAFRPTANGEHYHREVVERDFAAMVALGINAIRTYTLPPHWLLDTAQQHGLRVMVGMCWTQHTAFLDEPGRADAIERQVYDDACACAGHPAVLCYVIGNEIPAPIVRWLGARRVTHFLERLYRVTKAADPDGLVTYLNYPSTEYLRLPFIDLVCFNVYLESEDRLDAYLARLHNLAGERPLVMGEIGLDSRRHGEEGQARAIDWQVRTTFASGCAGAFVFSWTDEWHRGGADIVDWDFGLTRRDRSAKPALGIATRAMAEVPLPRHLPWPRISVVVCSYNGQRTLRECLEGVRRLDYPDYEVIVVDDGSTTDAVARIAGEYFAHNVRLIRTPNRGLSAARNTGLAAATGELVAYLDDDAYPDPHWLTYLAATFLKAPFVGVGGPNIPPPDDGPVANCVANAPGGPTHVLISDREAEHIPGCNMAFRKAALEAVGGFDPQFRVAGDDVDICWRLRDRGWTLGFSPAAVVWHHRRDSVRAFWRQQCGYGRAEALLERKWPEKYNDVGHLAWVGRIYSQGLAGLHRTRQRIYHGQWGTALFQSLYPPAAQGLGALVAMPEWYLVAGALALLAGGGVLWAPMLLALPVSLAMLGASFAQAVASALHGSFTRPAHGWSVRARLQVYSLTALLHLLEPIARLWGRVRYGLTPWRQRGVLGLALPTRRTAVFWSDRWQPPEERLRTVERTLRDHGAIVRRGGDFDRWDVEVRGGLVGGARLLMAVEEHGRGRQLVRFRCWPRGSFAGLAAAGGLTASSVMAAHAGARPGCVLLGALAVTLLGCVFENCAAATCTLLHAMRATDGIELGSRAPGARTPPPHRPAGVAARLTPVPGPQAPGSMDR